MQFVTITTAQALYAALGMSVFASALAITLTIMAYVHLSGRWDGRGERARERERTCYAKLRGYDICSACGYAINFGDCYCKSCGARVVEHDRD